MSNDLDDLLDEIAPPEVVVSDGDEQMDDGERYRERMRLHRRVRVRKRRRVGRGDDDDDDELMIGSGDDFDGPRVQRPRVGFQDSGDDDEDGIPIQRLQGVGGAFPDDDEEQPEALMPVRTYISCDVVSRELQLKNAGEASDDDEEQGEELTLTPKQRAFCVLCHFKPEHHGPVVRTRFEELLGIMVMRYHETDRRVLGKLAKRFYDNMIRPHIRKRKPATTRLSTEECPPNNARSVIGDRPYWSVDSILEHIEHHEIIGPVQRVRTLRTLLTALETIKMNHMFTRAEGEGIKVDSVGMRDFLRISSEVEKLLRKIDNQIIDGKSGTT